MVLILLVLNINYGYGNMEHSLIAILYYNTDWKKK